MLRRDGRCALETGRSGRQITPAAERDSEVHMGRQVVRTEPQCLPIADDRRFEIALFGANRAEVALASAISGQSSMPR
jgi:hypothetical protein